MNKKVFNLLTAALLLLTAACTNDFQEAPEVDITGETVDVTFALATEAAVQTRSDVVYPPVDKPRAEISDGTKANKLIYAVYDKDGNLLKQYGETDPNVIEAQGLGEGQLYKDVSDEHYPTKVTLRLVRGQEYKVSFWAQDPQCKAYNTADLRKVEVRYGEEFSINNDETRDAFCKTESFTAVESGTRTVVLRRPFAQINVGATGYDYEAASKGDCRVVESKIRIDRVARFLDVVSNNVDTSQESLQTIEYDYAVIPAYINMVDSEGNRQIPEEKYDYADRWTTGSYYTTTKGQEIAAPFYTWSQVGASGHYDDEALLVVDRNNDGVIDPFQNEDDELRSIASGEGASPATEKFKYLSMCYVLVADRNDGTSTYSTTLDNVYIYLKYHNDAMNEREIHLTQVPVQRNWRTNIIGELLTANIEFDIHLDPMYAGDYNYPEWLRIHEGVSFNPAEDAWDGSKGVLHISNGEGLLWLSEMTNGLVEDPTKADNSDSGAMLKQLILTAANESTWPSNNRFSFYNRHIKLDNDINLATLPNPREAYGKTEEGIPYWLPIGASNKQGAHNNSARHFSGFFDGQNHTISNMVTMRPDALIELLNNTLPKDDEVVDKKTGYGLFSLVSQGGRIANVRLKDIDIEAHFHAGGIAGRMCYGNGIDNCYVDGGTITSTPWEVGTNYWDDANGVGGIIGMIDGNQSGIWQSTGSWAINNCYVRNLTIRGYRSMGGIAGQKSAETGSIEFCNNTVHDVTLVADQFQNYGTPDSNGKFWTSEPVRTWTFLGRNANGTLDLTQEDLSSSISKAENNRAENVKIIRFVIDHIDGSSPDGTRYSNISDAPLGLFPRLLGKFADYVNFHSGIVGAPSAYKVYTDDDADEADETSGSVGMYIGDITIDGDAGEDNGVVNPDYVVTVVYTDQNGHPTTPDENGCVLFVKDQATVKNLTFRGDPYAYTGICLDPKQRAVIALESVSLYDVVNTLDDTGNGNNATLTVKDSNLRGYTRFSEGYASVTFENCVFENGSGTDKYFPGILEANSAVTFKSCKFRTGFKFKNTGASITFEDCTLGMGTELDPDTPITSADEVGYAE